MNYPQVVQVFVCTPEADILIWPLQINVKAKFRCPVAGKVKMSRANIFRLPAAMRNVWSAASF